jgi:PRTRC genetic system protein A
MEEADASDKHIRILPARDGHVYEIRCTEAGKFIARVENVRELSEVSAGFIPALPPVPFHLFSQVVAFFRSFMQDGYEVEALVHVYWDKAEQQYRIVPPMQSVSKAYISVVTPPDESLDAERYVHVADIHSHNSMPPFFSQTDNNDELATRVYMVVGHLDRPVPEISARISVGGRFVPIDARQVIENRDGAISAPPCRSYGHQGFIGQQFEVPGDAWFPSEWSDAVNVTETARYEAPPIEFPAPERGWFRLFLRKMGWPA